MRSLGIEPTKSTPRVVFSEEESVLRISGTCFPADASAFFSPIRDSIAAYLETRPEELTVELRLAYLNTSCSRNLLRLLKLLESNSAQDTDIRVVWRFDSGDEMALEWATLLKEELDLDFEIAAGDD